MKYRFLALAALFCLMVSLTVPSRVAESAGFFDADSGSNYSEAIR